MNITLTWLIHVGVQRSESKAVIEFEGLPTLILNPSNEGQEERNSLRQAPDALQPKYWHYEHISTIIAPRAGETTRYHYNLPGFESLAPATGLKMLYPGLSETHSQPIETQTLISALSDYGELTITHLVLEQPEQALELLTVWQSEGLLEQLKMLYVRASSESLYDGMPTQAELIAWCDQHGFEIAGANAEDPEFPLLSFKRNALHIPLKAAREEAEALNAKIIEYEILLKENTQQLSRAVNALRATNVKRKELKQECATLQLQRDEQAKATEAAKAETAKFKEARNALIQERNQVKDALTESQEKLEQTHTWFTKSTQQVEESAENLKKLQKEHETLKKALNEQREESKSSKEKLEQAQKILEKQEVQNNQLVKFQGRMEHLFNQQTLQLEQATNALGQHITQRSQNTTEELQHFIQVQQTFGANNQALHFEDQQLPANIALFLHRQLESNCYDVVLDIGAGVTTNYLANQLQRQGLNSLKLSHQPHKDADAYPVAEDGELPKRILAFTHQREISTTLEKHLKRQGLQALVELQFTPLVDNYLAGENYLFLNVNRPL
ncbi:hypothetical protein ACT3OH_15840, partial [Vreelandella zhanjiangensis]|uniref:hypothetical protein n=1 Tax=Vreelandella zhanjiangensis TaxID=1121960 RepID=UPI00402A73DA